jgi:hypothetical protein
VKLIWIKRNARHSRCGRGNSATLAGMTSPSHFELLLQAAASQPEPQRLLFVFAGAELPADATPAQRERFEAGQGGALTPLACVDKAANDFATFDALVAESRHASPPWQVVFIAGLAGKGGKPPSPAQVDSALQTMVENVRAGRFGGYLALGPDGEPLTFS